MRKIEKEMLAAVCEHRNWSSGNTVVVADNDYVQVILHGSIIYECKGVEEAFTLAGFDTDVTRNRLRSLGVNLFRKNGKTYASKCKSGANAIEIEKNEWYNF